MIDLETKRINESVEDPNFWNNLTKDVVLKWNPSGVYNQTFTPEYKKMLDCFHNLSDVPTVRVGDIIKGIISNITKKEIVIDINYKDSIYVDIKGQDFKIVQNLKNGDDISVMITDISETPYNIKGSITEFIKMEVADKLRKCYTKNTELLATVIEIIPAGFMLDIEMDNITITAFMPNTLAGVNRLSYDQIQDMQGKKIEVMLETLEQEKGVYVVSRKKYLQTLIPQLCKELKKDVIYTGTVTGSKDFGVFVEFHGCLTGMIHKVNLHENYHDMIGQIKPGTEIEFYIRDILKGDKIILTQILRESLWDTIRVGQIKEGVVKLVKPFGVLVALDDETVGLIQNSYIEKSNIKLSVGENIRVKIVSVIKDDRKIYLNLAQ